MTVREAYHFVWDAQAHVCGMLPEKAFFSEYPDLEAAMNTLGDALIILRREIRLCEKGDKR